MKWAADQSLFDASACAVGSCIPIGCRQVRSFLGATPQCEASFPPQVGCCRADDPAQPLRLGARERRSTIRTRRCQAQAIQYRMAGLREANKNNNFCSNDQKERDLADGDLCLRLHPP
jgi:hypothetical protein